MTMKYRVIIFFVVAWMGLASCSKDLNVIYLNKPDREKALSNPDDVYNIAKSSFYNWFMAINSSLSPRIGMWVAADQGTCSWANSGMHDLSKEPRIPFNNTTSYTYAYVFERFYQDMYSTLSQTNDVLYAVVNDSMPMGKDGKDSEMVKAFSYFIQGATQGYLSMVYDKVYIIDENTDLEALQLSTYQEGTAAAIASLDKCIAICEENHFNVPSDWINGHAYTNAELAELARSFAARFLVYMPRNKEENSQIDWDKVLAYANNGIKKPLLVTMDNATWKSWFRYYTVRPGWARIDCRIIHMMDDEYPWRFPDSGINPDPAQSDDARLETDFHFNSVNNMKPERGYYNFSNYEYSRYPYAITTFTGDVPDMLMAENDLIRAEAYARLGNLDEARNIINAGTRVTRGHLPKLRSNITQAKLLDAIFYERDIELIQTGFGIAFFDMRRRDMLQKGTLLNFPIPAKELMVMQMPIYTYGGVDNADGINTSNGGWFPSGGGGGGQGK
jgi:hypothetical protein